LKSYFKAIGMFIERFKEIKIVKPHTHVKPFPLTQSLFRKEKHTLTEEEWTSLKEVLPKKHKLLFTVKNHSGLRIQELLNLRVKDIVYVGEHIGKISVRKSKGG